MVRQLLPLGPKSRVDIEVARQSTVTTLLNVAAMMLSFITSVVLTRLLGTAGYGTYVYVLAWSALLVLGAQFGYSHLLVRNIAAYSARKEWGLVRGIIQRSQRVILAASAFLVVVAVGPGWFFLAQRQPGVRQSFFIALFLVPALALAAQREAVLRGFRRIALGRLPETIVQPGLLLALVVALYFALGRISAPMVVAATVAAALGALVTGTLLVSGATPSQVRAARPENELAIWSRSARSLLAINGLQVVNFQMSVILLGTIKTVDATAIFSVVLRLSGLVYFLQTAVAFPLAPAFATLHSRGSKARVQRLASQASLGVLLLALPIVMGLLLFGDLVLRLFGQQFSHGTTALAIMVVGEVVNIASGFGGIVLINTGHERTLFRVASWLTVLKVAFSLPLITLFGLEGAALSQALSSAVMNVVLAALAWRHQGIFTPAIGRGWFVEGAGPRGGSPAHIEQA